MEGMAGPHLASLAELERQLEVEKAMLERETREYEQQVAEFEAEQAASLTLSSQQAEVTDILAPIKSSAEETDCLITSLHNDDTEAPLLRDIDRRIEEFEANVVIDSHALEQLKKLDRLLLQIEQN